MTRLLRPFLIAAIAALSASGCVVYPGTARSTTYEELRREEGWILLDGVPLVTQATEQDCGAASLSMVLAHWGVEAPAETLERECAVAGEEGLRASALRDAARRRELSAFVFAGRVADLEHELKRGRPVVVGLIKSLGPLTTSHYEVVVGLNPGREKVAALDPAVGLVWDTLSGFAVEWAQTKGVTLVVFRPEVKTASTSGGNPSKGGGP